MGIVFPCWLASVMDVCMYVSDSVKMVDLNCEREFLKKKKKELRERERERESDTY